MNYDDIKVKTMDNIGLKEDVSMQTLIDLNIKLIREYYEEIKNQENKTEKLNVYRNLLLKELIFTLAVKPTYADEIMAAVDNSVYELYN